MDSETKQVLASICEILRDESRRAIGVAAKTFEQSAFVTPTETTVIGNGSV